MWEKEVFVPDLDKFRSKNKNSPLEKLYKLVLKKTFPSLYLLYNNNIRNFTERLGMDVTDIWVTKKTYTKILNICEDWIRNSLSIYEIQNDTPRRVKDELHFYFLLNGPSVFNSKEAKKYKAKYSHFYVKKLKYKGDY